MSGAEFEIDPAVFAEVLSSGEMAAAIDAVGAQAQEFWKSIAPVNETGKPHKLKSGYVDHPGDYQRSIKRSMRAEDGKVICRVEADDYKSHWLEYGSVHNDPPPEPMLHTLAFLRAEGLKVADAGDEVGDLLGDILE